MIRLRWVGYRKEMYTIRTIEYSNIPATTGHNHSQGHTFGNKIGGMHYSLNSVKDEINRSQYNLVT
jgi:hypothetical protein